MKTTLGGKRLGSGNKMDVEIKGYGRSNHNLNKIIRTTMSAGTLVPAYRRLVTPGAELDFNIRAAIQTNPTLGALYGRYIFGVDMFQIPLRIYIGGLQYNAKNLATQMQNMKFPMIEISAKTGVALTDNSQINSSCVFKYLGIKGLGADGAGWGNYQTRQFHAITTVGYYDVFNNYYANKQEDTCYMIHTEAVTDSATSITMTLDGTAIEPQGQNTTSAYTGYGTDGTITFTGSLNIDTVQLWYLEDSNGQPVQGVKNTPIRYLYNTISGGTSSPINLNDALKTMWVVGYTYEPTNSQPVPKLTALQYADFDKIRPILNSVPVGSTYVIDKDITISPYKELLSRRSGGNTSLTNSQEGLMVKTYQSDLNNNFIKTEEITNINSQTSVSTVGDSFTIDSLNFAIKLNNLQQREVAAGGTLQDYIQVAYGVEMYAMTQIPMFIGGMREHIVFDEVVSNAATAEQELGYIAGRGRFSGNKKGGNISVSINEWSYIMAIAHITPEIDYSQGNGWDVGLENMDQIHKPALDEIGYQDKMVSTLAWWDYLNNAAIPPVENSMGKQPAWIDYTSDINETFGLFAEEDNLMFMTLNRRYEKNPSTINIQDLTTYIDPVKFNYIFAQTELSAQNFRVQIAFDVFARQKMSSRIIPNL